MTFVSRGLESIRGFDIFMDVARRIARERPDVLFVVVGNEETYYGWDKLHTGQPSFKKWVIERGQYDLSRFLFLGQIDPTQAGRGPPDDRPAPVPDRPVRALLVAPERDGERRLVVLASDVPPVREVIEPGVNGLVEPLFDVDRLTETALRVLDDPASLCPAGEGGARDDRGPILDRGRDPAPEGLLRACRLRRDREVLTMRL